MQQSLEDPKPTKGGEQSQFHKKANKAKLSIFEFSMGHYNTT